MARRQDWTPDFGHGLKFQLERMLHDIRKGRRPRNLTSSEALEADYLAQFIAQAFYHAGYKTRLKMVKQPGLSEFHHVFVEVWHPQANEWIPIDPHRTPPQEWDEEAIVGI